MLKEEVDNLIARTEAELVELITFIKSVENDVNRSISQTCNDGHFCQQKDTSTNQFSNTKKIVGGSATNDAFLIVENALLRICNLLDQFSSFTTEDEESSDIYAERYLYAVYVYRVASYLVETIKNNLETFHKKLRKLASPVNSDKSEEFDFNETKNIPGKQDPKRNFPIRSLKFKSEISRHLHWLYEQPKMNQCPCKDKHYLDNPKAENIFDSKYCVHTQSEFMSTYKEKMDSRIPCKRNINQDCFSRMCANCWDLYQENVESAETELRFVDSDEVDSLRNKPSWNPSDSEQAIITKPFIDSLIQDRTKCNSTECDNPASAFYKTQNTEDHGTQTYIFEEAPPFSENAIKSDDSLEMKYLECHKPLKKATRPVSTGILRAPTSKKDLPLGLTSFRTENYQGKCESCESKTSDVLDERKVEIKGRSKPFNVFKYGRNVKPLLLKDLKENLDSATGEFGGFSLLPGITSSSVPKVNILVQKTNDDDDLPRAFIFDIDKCSTLLKEKFKGLLEQSSDSSDSDEESARVLGIIFDSIGEATNVYAKRGEISSEEHNCGKNETDFLKEILNTAKRAMVSGETSDEEQENPTCMDTFAKKLRNGEKKLLTKKFHKRGKHHAVSSYACRTCQTMIKAPVCQLNNFHSCTKTCLIKESLRSTCYVCMNSRQRDQAIHRCHKSLPKGLLEIRHMDDIGNVCVCFLFWNRTKEQDDWRWQKNPFYDPTRVEIEQETNLGKNAVLRVIFGSEGTMLKKSLAKSQLPLVCDSAKYPNVEEKSSSSASDLHKKYRKDKLTHDGNWEHKLEDNEKKLLTKLGRFFDDIQKVGYGEGPPLVLRLRRKFFLHDAYELLSVPSNIRLNYYRRLRIIFVSDFDSKVGPSATNFRKEDEIDELFELFESQLFTSTEKSLFVYPSEETRCVYFNPDPNTQSQWFAFAGIVLALAILHQKKLHVKFPLCLFKCLLDRTVNIQDLREIDPMVFQRLMWIRENNIPSHYKPLTFTIKDKIGDRTYENELMVDGSQISVTEKNKFRYIDLVVKWKLAERYLTQLKEFRRGFASVIDPHVLKNFTERELRSLIMHPPDPGIFLRQTISEEEVPPRDKISRKTL